MINKIITKNLDDVKSLCAKHNVKNLFLFGSACTDKFSISSDIDLLVSFKSIPVMEHGDNYFSMSDKLETIFNRPVDLIESEALSNPYFIDAVNKTKVLLYEA